jgi:hypothetical protein
VNAQHLSRCSSRTACVAYDCENCLAADGAQDNPISSDA